MALRISRKGCTLGRPVALGVGRWGSIQDHSASDKSVWYALLMLGTLPSRCPRMPFRTVSLGFSVNKDIARTPSARSLGARSLPKKRHRTDEPHRKLPGVAKRAYCSCAPTMAAGMIRRLAQGSLKVSGGAI